MFERQMGDTTYCHVDEQTILEAKKVSLLLCSFETNVDLVPKNEGRRRTNGILTI